MINYPVNEIFVTVQGEGSFTGHPSIFIRLQGCAVACPWCDTKHTWNLDQESKIDNPLQIVDKTGDAASWAFFPLDKLIEQVKKFAPSHVVITGGEPLQYDLLPLCLALEELGKTVQIETSGTNEPRISAKSWMTLSPKFDMPGGKNVIDSAVSRANEIKMPVGKSSDINKLHDFIAQYQVKSSIWLQPLSQNKSATQLCIDEAIKNNWRLSIQTHKYLNIR